MDAKDYKASKILLKVNDNVEVEQKACTAHGFVRGANEDAIYFLGG